MHADCLVYNFENPGVSLVWMYMECTLVHNENNLIFINTYHLALHCLADLR